MTRESPHHGFMTKELFKRGRWRASVFQLFIISFIMPLLAGAPAPARSQNSGDARRQHAPSVVATMAPSDEMLTHLIRLRSRARNFTSQWGWENNRSIVEGFSADMGGGRITATCRIDWYKPREAHRARVEFASVDLRALLTALGIQFNGRVEAPVTGTLDFRWRGLRLREIKSTLDGTASMRLGAGTAGNMAILDYLARVSGIGSLRQIQIDDGLLEGECKSGVLEVKSVGVNGPQMRIRARGRVELASENLSALVELSVTPSLAAQSLFPEIGALLEFMARGGREQNKEGFVDIPYTAAFGGTLAKPQFLPGGFPPEKQ